MKGNEGVAASSAEEAARLPRAGWLAVGLLFAPLCMPLLAGRTFALDDLSAFHLPLRYLYKSALADHHSILWTSKMFGGFYLHGEGQVGAMHPLHAVLYYFLPLVLAFHIELIASYVFGCAGMWLFLRRWGLSRLPRLGGSLAFAFSGFALLHLPHMNAIAISAHVPWLLMASDLSLSDDLPSRRRGRVALAMLLGSQILLGYPQYVWMSGLIAGLYLFTNNGLRSVRRVAGLLGAVTAGALLGAVQLLPTLDVLSESIRRTFDDSFTVSFSLHPLNLVQLVSPYLLVERVFTIPEERYLHEFGLYSGALGTLTLGWALLRRRGLPCGRLAVFAAVTCVLGLLLALGQYGGLYPYLANLPLVSSFRAPSRHIVLVHFGVAILIGIVLEDLERRMNTPRRPSIRLGWLWTPLVLNLLVAGVAVTWPSVLIRFDEQTLHPPGMVSGALLLCVVTLVFLDAARGSRSALALLVVVMAADLGFYGYSYVLEGGIRSPADIARSSLAPPGPAGSTVAAMLPDVGDNTLVLRDFRVLSAYAGLTPARRVSLQTTEGLRLAGAAWVHRDGEWQPVPEPARRVRIVAATADVHDGIEAHGSGAAAVITDVPGTLVIDVRTDAQTLLVTTERYHEGWRARTATGSALPTRRVRGDYLGVVLDPGSYPVTLTFEPASFRHGMWMTAAGVAATLVLLVLPRRGRWREPRA